MKSVLEFTLVNKVMAMRSISENDMENIETVDVLGPNSNPLSSLMSTD